MASVQPIDVIRALSVDIGPRLGGSEGSHRARDYLAELLGAMGLEVSLQHFSYVGWDYDRQPELELLSPARERVVCAATAFTAATGGPVEGRVWEDGVVPAIPGIFDFVRLAVGENGERRASILVPPGEGPAFPLPNIQRTFQEPSLYISKEDGDRILDLLGGGEDVRVRLQTFGRHVPGFTDANVVARLPGKSTERIVVCAHYDTAWNCPGAVDNASGVAAMVELARRIQAEPRHHTFEFIAFAAEEWWLFGSDYFTEEALRRNELGLYRGVVNCDPLGPGDILSCWVGPDFLRGLATQIIHDLGITDRHEVVYTDPHTGTDHYPFWAKGRVPAFFPIFVPVPPEYHQPADTVEIFDQSKLDTIIELNFQVALALDRQVSAAAETTPEPQEALAE